MVVQTTQKCIGKTGDEVATTRPSPFACLPRQRATVTLASGNDFAGELLGGAAPNSLSVRCPSCSLGVLIKPHETNEASVSRSTRSAGRSLEQKQKSFVVPARPLPPTHPGCLMWSGWLPFLKQAEPDVTEKHTQS